MQLVGLGHKSLIDRYTSLWPYDDCEKAFANMFLWAQSRQIFCGEIEGHLIATLQKPSHPRGWYQPIGPDPKKIMLDVLPASRGFLWENIEETVAETMRPSQPLYVQRDRYDYIYSKDDIATLPGERYAHKRNYIKRCIAAYNPQTCMLSSADAVDVLDLFDRWREMKKCDPRERGIIAEREALVRAMQHFSALRLTGIGVRIHGNLEAIAIGAPVHAGMMTEIFEKATSTFTGLYQYTFRAFAQALPQTITLINKEEDVGIPGLRKAKEDWHPQYLLKKYSLDSGAILSASNLVS